MPLKFDGLAHTSLGRGLIYKPQVLPSQPASAPFAHYWLEWNRAKLALEVRLRMHDELQALRDAGYKPTVIGPQPFSFEELLRNVDPAPDEEIERFVAVIYADRRQAAENSPSE
jgi:hypothetical protein